MNIYISVVSHGHGDILKSINCLPELAKKYHVIVKCNTFQDVGDLSEWCENSNINIINDEFGLGFGENNNTIFKYCEDNLDMKGEDFFIIFNPDLSISNNQIEELIETMSRDNVSFGAINLFKDNEKTIYDPSVRRFPGLIDFFTSFFLGRNLTIIDKSKIKSSITVDWTAGSFMAIKSGHYKNLGGFDKKYFMYCEDIDLCYRSWLHSIPIIYYPEIHALHLARHANRRIFSKHFIWHLKSIFKFLYFKHKNKLTTK